VHALDSDDDEPRAPPVNLLGCKPDYRKMNGKNMEKKVLPPY
jgi:hypothetical protein